MWGFRETYRAALIGGLGNIEFPWLHRVDLHNSRLVLLLLNMPLAFHLLLSSFFFLRGFWKKLLQVATRDGIASQVPKIWKVWSWAHLKGRIYSTATGGSGRLITWVKAISPLDFLSCSLCFFSSGPFLSLFLTYLIYFCNFTTANYFC